MATLTKKERAWLNELQDVLDRCPSPKKIGFYTIGDKSIYLYDLRRMDEISKRAARTVLTGMCYSVGSATRQGSSSPTRFIGQSAMTSRT
ncbi:hypothetical protein ESCOCP327M_21855 [Escherichia coli]